MSRRSLVATSISTKLGIIDNVVPIRADITVLDDVERMVEEAERAFGKLDHRLQCRRRPRPSVPARRDDG